MEYKAISEEERLAVVRMEIRNRELEHFRTTLNNIATEDALAKARIATLVHEIEELRKVETSLSA